MLDGISYKFIHRSGTEGFKPRNLDIAMQYICFDYVLFLDADSTLPENTLKVAFLSEFKRNSKLGFVSFLVESTNYNKFNYQSCKYLSKYYSLFQRVC